MAKADFRMPDDFLNRLSRLEKSTGDVIPKVLETGGKVCTGASTKQPAVGVALSGKFSGQLEQSLGLSPVKVDQNGDFNVKVGFGESRRTVTDRLYIEHEDDTGYHHYAIDIAKIYPIEE